MLKRNKGQAPQREHGGVLSYILLQQGDMPSGQFSVMWVEIEPGSGQPRHQHGPEQAYIIIRGNGRMRVGDEEDAVSIGDIVYVPPNVAHSIENLGAGPLTYITVASPAFNLASLLDTGELPPTSPSGR